MVEVEVASLSWPSTPDVTYGVANNCTRSARACHKADPPLVGAAVRELEEKKLEGRDTIAITGPRWVRHWPLAHQSWRCE